VILGGEETSKDVAQKRAPGTEKRMRFCEPGRDSERRTLRRDKGASEAELVR